MILMLVLMGSVSAVAQGLKIKRFSYAKSGDLLKGEQIYSRNRESRSLDSQQGYAPTPWILYLENGGHVSLQFPDGQIHQVVPGVYDFSYYNNGEKMYVDVRVVPYAVPYLGELRLQGAVSGSDNVRLEKTVSEEDFFTYTIKSDADLMKTIKINPQGGHEIDGNLGIHAALTQKFPERDYEYALRLPSEQERMFANGVSVNSLKDMAVQQGLNSNDFVLQIGLDAEYGGIIFSEVYLDQARLTKKTTFLRIIDKRPQIKKVTLTTKISPVGAGSVLINEASQPSIQVDQGTQVRLEAQVARQEYLFDHWQDAAGQSLGTDSQLSYVVSKDQTITAIFKKKEYVVKAASSDETLGTVNPATLTVKAGGEARFTATAKENAIFKGWKKGLAEVSVTGSVLKLTNVQEASEWTAVFEKKEFEVKASSNDLALGTVEPAMLTVKAGGEVTFTATAKENVIFKGWKKGTAEVSVTESVLKLTDVQEASEWTAVFEKKASTPEVGAVDLQFGQREAILTWAPGSATSWQIKLYRSDTKLVKTILTQLPRVELESLIPGEVYHYELVAKRQGKLDSQVKQGTFKTDQFNEREALAPYLKNFSKLLRGKAFDLIWMDVNLSEFDQETPIYEYYWQLNETSPKVLLIPDGKQLTLDTNQVGGCLIILIKSGDTLLYEVRYELDK